MKALILNGSPHEHGTTRRALDEMIAILKESDVDAEVMTVGNKSIRGCIACGRCNGRCVAFDDDVNRALGYLPANALDEISRRLRVPKSQLFSVSSFYRMFSTKPRGKHVIQFCESAPCHVVGGRQVWASLLDHLKKSDAARYQALIEKLGLRR